MVLVQAILTFHEYSRLFLVMNVLENVVREMRMIMICEQY